MRTAVVRVNVDPSGALTAAQLSQGMGALRGLVGKLGHDIVENNLGAMPPSRRVIEMLIAGDDVEVVKDVGVSLCAKAFGTRPLGGAVTFISRGTDEDARGVLSAFGLAGEIVRVPGDDGFDIVYVTLLEADLDRVPESRIHTALEASLNCEVHIRTV
ncbi:hypothetical protein [Mycobacterium sp. 4858]|uniref:hypothetical protein n=1 Tax=Mycobacterium sp. 4858 TaxID=2057185 RepID=UPI000C8374FD|nr:hypothetical protein [Mycobacterium sp. 4858]